MLIFRGHRSPIRQMAFSPDGSQLASIAGQGYAISLWDATTGTREAYLSTEFRTPLTTIAFVPNELALLCTPKWGWVYHWDLKTCRETRLVQRPISGYPIDQLLITEDAKTVYIALQRWPAMALHKIDLTKSNPEAKSIIRLAQHYPYPRSCLSMSLASNHLWVAMALHLGEERKLALIDLPNNKEIDVQVAGIQAVAFSPDARHLALGRGSDIVLLDTHHWQEIATLSQHSATVNSLSYSPDGRLLLSGGDDESVRMWNLSQERELQSFNWELGAITQVTFAPDGMRAAAGGKGQIIIWDVED